ncbi:MAG: dephospho-CoA kinase [Candidatus Sabulitectum sp.]|nr:dephospho-CoA kinase [Candidatus Sabulitectum sp.]
MFWGLTGCSGTGVSTVAAVWNRLGAHVCSLDAVGHGFLNKPAVKKALESELGIQGLSSMSGEQIREQLRERAFAFPEILGGINRVLHPRLKRWVANSVEELRDENGVFVLDAALIFELGLDNYLSRTVTVTDRLERVMKRLTARDGISKDTVTGRWQNQISLREKSMRSHFVIRNASTEEMLKKNAENFYKEVIQRMEEPGGTQNKKETDKKRN